MKKLYFLCAIALLFFATLGCDNKKDDNNYTYPPCMQEQIDIYLTNNPTPPITSSPLINKYSCNGKIVYNWEEGNPDELSYMVDMDCDTIGELGGIDGRNTCKCKLRYIETVWKDNRKKE